MNSHKIKDHPVTGQPSVYYLYYAFMNIIWNSSCIIHSKRIMKGIIQLLIHVNKNQVEHGSVLKQDIMRIPRS